MSGGVEGPVSPLAFSGTGRPVEKLSPCLAPKTSLWRPKGWPLSFTKLMSPLNKSWHSWRCQSVACGESFRLQRSLPLFHPLPEGPGGVDAQEAGCSGRERRQHHQVLGSGPVHQSALFRAPKLSKKRYLPKNTVKVSISTTGTVLLWFSPPVS